MRHLIVVCLAFMMGLNVACSRVEDLGKDDLHSEPTIEIVSGDTLDIVGFTLAHELATSEGLSLIHIWYSFIFFLIDDPLIRHDVLRII